MERNVDLLKSQFDIDREPFSDVGVTGLFFPGGGRQALLEQLLHLVRYGPPMLFLHGAEGVGKTTIALQLARHLDTSIFTHVTVEASVLMDDKALMATIGEGFSLNVEWRVETFVPALSRYAAEAESYAQTSLVIVDNVHNLSEAAVAVLATSIQAVSDKGVRFLLLVDDIEQQAVGVLAPFNELLATHGQELVVGRLRDAEVEQYICYRMRTAGLDGVRFSPQQIKEIVRESRGNIAAINQVSRATLVRQVPVEPKGKAPAFFSHWHGIAIIVISACLLMLFSIDTEDRQDSGEAHLPLPVVVDSQKTSEVVPAVIPAPDVNNEPVPIVEEDIDLNYSEVSDVSDAEPAESTRIEDEFEFNSVNTALDQPSGDRRPSQKPVSAAKPTIKVAVPKAVYTVREQWLLSLDKRRYTLQMLGARDEKAVQSFISRYPSLDQVAYYKTLYKGKDWYVVVYGAFLTKSDAQKAVAELPKALIASKPWIRPLEQIQRDIRKVRS